MAGSPNAMRWLSSRRAAVAMLLVAWLLIVASGAGRGTDAAEWLDLPDLRWLLDVVLVLVVLAAVAMLILLLTIRGPSSGKPTRRNTIWPMVFLLVLVLFVSLFFSGRDLSEELVTPEPAPTGVAAVESEPSESAAEPSEIDRSQVAALLGILAVAAAVFAVSRRRAPEVDEEYLLDEVGEAPPTLEVELSAAVAVATEELLVEGAPRTAVLKAYQGLEQMLDRRGLPRAPTETPTEHLQRVLADLAIDLGALYRLSELYQVARYSDHEITVDDQRDAATAFRRIRDEMATSA